MLDIKDMWNISGGALDKSPTEDDTETEKIEIKALVTGYVIDEQGFIIDKFGFETANVVENGSALEIILSDNGHLSKMYDENMNMIFGYGSPAGLPAVVDLKKSTMLTLGPDDSNGEEYILKIDNDNDLINLGVNIIIKAEDVALNRMEPEMREQFNESLIEARTQTTDELNPTELSYIDYLKSIYEILTYGKTLKQIAEDNKTKETK